MTPSYAIKKGVRYRYYVSCVLAQGRKEEAGPSRVAADAVEQIVLNAIGDRGLDPDIAAAAIAARIGKATLGARSIEIRLAAAAIIRRKRLQSPGRRSRFAASVR